MAEKVATDRKMRDNLPRPNCDGDGKADNKQQAFINTDTRCFKIQTGDVGPPPPGRASMFAEKSFCPPLIESHLREKAFTPSAVYELPFKITIESFQFKLIHNILPTNQRLGKMNDTSSSKCTQCDAPCETISHIFYECLAVKIFGKKS